MTPFGDLKLSGLSTMTENIQPLPSIVGVAAYVEDDEDHGRTLKKPPLRKWLILNGMNAGRWTMFFGAPCIADLPDCVQLLQSHIERIPELKVVRYEIHPQEPQCQQN